jgi:hypothetical protein
MLNRRSFGQDGCAGSMRVDNFAGALCDSLFAPVTVSDMQRRWIWNRVRNRHDDRLARLYAFSSLNVIIPPAPAAVIWCDG